MNAWIDIDNAPHVAIFAPIIRDLRAEGASVHVTARARTFVPELLEQAGIAHDIIGRGQPVGFFAKAGAVGTRSLALVRWAKGRHLDVAVGHGSRSLPIAARLAGVPNLTTFDYEYVNTGIFQRCCDRIVVPKVVLAAIGARSKKWASYDGFKEEIYLPSAAPRSTIRADLAISESDVLVVVRPPSRTAHYHDATSVAIADALLARARDAEQVKVVWLQRDPGDPTPQERGVIVPMNPVNGIDLLATADVVVSGGGTMTREAALLGTPSFSIFTGPVGAVDAELVRRGWLRLIRTPGEVATISLERKHPAQRPRIAGTVREQLLSHIMATARREAVHTREVSWESPS
jgi:predicted glycosyltransferase